MFKIGIDLGGTKTEAVILEEQGTIVKRDRVATGQDRGYDYVVKVAAEAVLGAGKGKKLPPKSWIFSLKISGWLCPQ